MRAEECSGPCPSQPWGSIKTKPEERFHLVSAEAMNWSMMTWAGGEVAKLRFPQDEHPWIGQGIAVLVAQAGALGQRRIVHADATLLLAEMVKRAVLLATVLIDEDRMSVAEGATLDVLSGQTNGMSFQEERAKRQQFASRPVHLTAIFHGFGTGLGQALQLAVEFEVCGKFGQTVADFTQGGQRDIGLDGFVVPLFGQTRPMVPVPGLQGHGGVFGSRLGFVEAFPSGGSHALRRFHRRDALLNEPLRMGFGNAGLVLDAFVQLGLGEGGLVALVVSVTPVAPHFNHHIGAKFLPVSQRQSSPNTHASGSSPLTCKIRDSTILAKSVQ